MALDPIHVSSFMAIEAADHVVATDRVHVESRLSDLEAAEMFAQ